jgi:hypothetical protein
VEEDTILVVGEGVVDLLVPYNTAIGRLHLSVFLLPDSTTCTYRYVHQFQPESVADQVIRQYCSALQPSIGPSVLVRIGNIQLRNGDSVDLIRRLWNSALHRLLVLVRENRRHGGGFRGLELRMVKNEVQWVPSAGVRVLPRDWAAHVGVAVTISCDVNARVRVRGWGW